MVRIFGDPMQRIFAAGNQNAADLDKRRWTTLIEKADVHERLCFPHRWKSGSPALGEWILSVREVLRAGKRVSMRPPNPAGLKIIVADNESKSPVGYQLSKENTKELHSVPNRANTLLVLAAHKDTVDAVHSLFGRRIRIWEGHIRESLDALISSVQQDQGRSN